MSVIRTKRNMVCAYEPLPTDNVVMTRIGNARAYVNIDRYCAAVRNAVEAADDHADGHIDVVPMTITEFVQHKSGISFGDWLNSLPAATIETLRQDCIEACAEALRYCEEPAVRAEAAWVLAKLGVVR
ncbi:MAG: hypothetical protein KBA31_07915 [Alphaproteobacteria bacterium]|nr:hypothetical protein [Alphaproteobacteria bacterium]